MKSFAGKNVLITGATGLIGSNLAENLLKCKDVQITILARNENKVKSIFRNYLNRANFNYLIQDIKEPINSISKFDFIFHCAGSISPDTFNNYPVEVLNSNIKGIINCLEYIKRQGFGRIVLLSSATVYGNRKKNCITVNEKDTEYIDKTDSSSYIYSESKRMAEIIARAYYKQYLTDVIIARFSYVYGYARKCPNTAIFNFIKKALNGEDIILNNTVFERRDNIYITDAVSLICLAALNGISGEVYNISSNNYGNNYASIDEIAVHIVNAANKIKKTNARVIKKENTNNIDGIIMDNSKILLLSDRKVFMITSLKDGIFKTVQMFDGVI